LPRGRPKKENNSIEQSTTQIDEQFAKQFAKAMNTVLNTPSIFNPFWQNQILKDLSISGLKYDREKIKQMLADPKNNERQLRELSNFIFNYILQYKRLVMYYAEMLSFDWSLEPTNADKEDMSTKAFKKSYKKALEWLDEFDPKVEFRKVTNGIMLEDAKFYYVRESQNGIRLQEMPSSYCMISGYNDLGYQYSFNLTYFLKPGIDFNDFAPEFRDYYMEFVGGTDYQSKKSGYDSGIYAYWKKLDPARAWVFKFDQNHAAISPPLSPLFLDAMEIVNFKELLKTKTSLDVYKLIINKIPLHKDGGKTGNKKDDFSITADTAGMFTQLMQATLPPGIKAITSPLEAEAIDFAQADNKNSIVGLGNKEFWDTSGTSPVMFGEGQLNASGLQASIKTDELFVEHLYKQFERFVNFQLKQVTGRFRFRIKFEGTKFDRQERFERAIQAVQYGAPVSLLATSLGKTPQEFMNLIDFEESMGWKDRMKPLMSSHTTSGKEGGRPKQSTVGDAGEQTRDDETNLNR
jgi:hypothetical protein